MVDLVSHSAQHAMHLSGCCKNAIIDSVDDDGVYAFASALPFIVRPEH